MNRSIHIPSQHQYPPQPYQNIPNNFSTLNVACCCQLKSALVVIAIVNMVSEFIACVYFGLVYRDFLESHQDVYRLGGRYEGNPKYSSSWIGYTYSAETILTITFASGLNFVVMMGFLISVLNTFKPLCYICHLMGWIMDLIIFVVSLSHEYGRLSTPTRNAWFVISVLIFVSYHGYESILVYYYLVKSGPTGVLPGYPNPRQVYPETQSLYTPSNTGQQYVTPYSQPPPSYYSGGYAQQLPYGNQNQGNYKTYY